MLTELLLNVQSFSVHSYAPPPYAEPEPLLRATLPVSVQLFRVPPYAPPPFVKDSDYHLRVIAMITQLETTAVMSIGNTPRRHRELCIALLVKVNPESWPR